MAIVVTGGAGLIGTAIVRLLCERGHSVILQYCRSENQAKSLQMQWPHLVSLFQGDLLLPDDVTRFVDVLHRQKQIHGLINNAGLFIRNPLTETWQPETEWMQIQLNTLIPPVCVMHCGINWSSQVVNCKCCRQREWFETVRTMPAMQPAKRVYLPLRVLSPLSWRRTLRQRRWTRTHSRLEQEEQQWSHLIAKIPMERCGMPTGRSSPISNVWTAYITGQLLCVDGGWSLSP